MPSSPDLVGQSFGRLVVESKTNKRCNGKVLWECVCQCGQTTFVSTGNLRSGTVSSCGCSRLKHDMFNTKVYAVWATMKYRCKSTNRTWKKNYLDRDITYDPKWETFEGFWEDMEEGYEEGLTLDRIDNDGNYCKDNCRWTTRSVQSRNRRVMSSSGFYGVTLDKRSMSYSVRARLLDGKSVYLGFGRDPEILARIYDEFVIKNNLPNPLNFKEDK